MAITFINYIPTGDGNYIDFEKLSPEEKKKTSDKITTRLMESMGYRKKVAVNQTTQRMKGC